MLSTNNENFVIQIDYHGWLNRPYSCTFTNTFHSCVSKAQNHLFLLKAAIEVWLKDAQKNNEINIDRSHSFISKISSINSTAIVTQINPDDNQSLLADTLNARPESDRKPLSSVHDHVKTTSMRVEGISIEAANKDSHIDETTKITYLSAEHVFHSVVSLLERLQENCTRMMQDMQHQRSIVEDLEGSLEKYSYMRFRVLPEAVEKEHEACADDILELKWYVELKTKARDKLIKKCDHVDSMRTQMLEEISNHRHQIPLIKEKLDLELNTMTQISDAKEKLLAELKFSKNRMMEVEKKYETTLEKATEVRESLKKEMAKNEKIHEESIKNLKHAQKVFEKTTNKIDKAKNMIIDNKNQAEVLKTTTEEREQTQNVLDSELVTLRKKMKELEFEYRCCKENLMVAENDKKSTEKDISNQKEDLTNGKNDQEERLIRLKRVVNELQIDNSELEKKLIDCKKQKNSDASSIERINGNILELKENLINLNHEFNRVAELRAKAKETFELEQKKLKQEEDKMRETISGLEKQIKEEIYTRSMLESRIVSDTNDLAASKDDAKLKRKNMRKMLAEVNELVRVLTEKVVKLRGVRTEHDQIVADSQEKLDKLRKAHEASQAEIKSHTDHLQPIHTSNKSEMTALEKKLEHMTWQTQMIYKNLDDMIKNSQMILRNKRKVAADVKIDDENLSDLSIKLQRSEREESTLEKQLKELNDRNSHRKGKHVKCLQDRQQTLDQLNKQLEENCGENARLAGQYRQMQQDYMDAMERFLNERQGNIWHEADIGDLRQIEMLQNRMHHRLAVFLKSRDAWEEGELVRLEQTGEFNEKRVASLQTKLYQSLNDVGMFLAQANL